VDSGSFSYPLPVRSGQSGQKSASAASFIGVPFVKEVILSGMKNPALAGLEGKMKPGERS
jgi:hypothetical protein